MGRRLRADQVGRVGWGGQQPRLRHRDGADVSVAVDPVPGRRLREPECGDEVLLPGRWGVEGERGRSEEHTSELQSRLHLVCRLLLEKKKTDKTVNIA